MHFQTCECPLESRESENKANKFTENEKKTFEFDKLTDIIFVLNYNV